MHPGIDKAPIPLFPMLFPGGRKPIHLDFNHLINASTIPTWNLHLSVGPQTIRPPNWLVQKQVPLIAGSIAIATCDKGHRSEMSIQLQGTHPQAPCRSLLINLYWFTPFLKMPPINLQICKNLRIRFTIPSFLKVTLATILESQSASQTQRAQHKPTPAIC